MDSLLFSIKMIKGMNPAIITCAYHPKRPQQGSFSLNFLMNLC